MPHGPQGLSFNRTLPFSPGLGAVPEDLGATVLDPHGSVAPTGPGPRSAAPASLRRSLAVLPREDAATPAGLAAASGKPRYEEVKPLGEGSFGEVLLARGCCIVPVPPPLKRVLVAEQCCHNEVSPPLVRQLVWPFPRRA